MDSAYVRALLQIVCIVQMLPSALNRISDESTGEAGRKGS